MNEGLPDDPIVVAASDQLKSEAIERLKEAEMFGVIVPAEIDGEEGITIMFSGRISLMLEMHQMLTTHLAKHAAQQFLADLEQSSSERDLLDEYLNFRMEKGGEE